MSKIDRNEGIEFWPWVVSETVTGASAAAARGSGASTTNTAASFEQ